MTESRIFYFVLYYNYLLIKLFITEICDTTPTCTLEIPEVTVTADDEASIEFMPIEPSLNYFVHDEQKSNFEPSLLENDPDTSSLCMTSIPPPPPLEEDEADEVQMDTTEFLSQHQPECSSTEESKKAMNLKCCRRPYNGHTFSVSPNQVVNITSIVDCSKFSVRHLVNEFEQQSKGSIGGGSSGDSTNTLEILSHKSARSPQRTKVRIRPLNNCDTDYTSGEDNQEESNDMVPILPQLMIGTSTASGVTSLRDLQTTKSSKNKGEKLGCLPFFRKYSSVSKSSQNSKKSEGGDKSRKGKILDTVAKLSENGDCMEQLPAKYQSTGVVKQRLEAFEAKAVPPNSKHQLFFRSHNRSHSATGSTVPGSPGSLQFDSLAHLSQRKSSMPQLTSENCKILFKFLMYSNCQQL